MYKLSKQSTHPIYWGEVLRSHHQWLQRVNPNPKQGRVPKQGDLSGEDLSGLRCTGKSMRSMVFVNANLTGVKWQRCDLRCCDFTGADLTGADLSKSRLTGARFTHTILVDVKGLDSTVGGDFTGADFTGLTKYLTDEDKDILLKEYGNG